MEKNKADIFLQEILEIEPPPSCVCETCTKMCEREPCWGTPEEIQRIIEAGYGDKLCPEPWDGINIIPMRKMEYYGVDSESDIRYQMSCIFLENQKCILHEKGLKPIEGKLAHCSSSKNPSDIREKLLSIWEQHGKEILQDFLYKI